MLDITPDVGLIFNVYVSFHIKHDLGMFDCSAAFSSRVIFDLGPGPGWGPVRVGAWSGFGPIWAHRALMGSYGPDFVKKPLILMKNHTIVN